LSLLLDLPRLPARCGSCTRYIQAREELKRHPKRLWRIRRDVNVVPGQSPIRKFTRKGTAVLNARRASNRGNSKRSSRLLQFWVKAKTSAPKSAQLSRAPAWSSPGALIAKVVVAGISPTGTAIFSPLRVEDALEIGVLLAPIFSDPFRRPSVVVLQSLARLRLRPTSRVEYPVHSRRLGLAHRRTAYDGQIATCLPSPFILPLWGYRP
jgi:hypothetical protein